MRHVEQGRATTARCRSRMAPAPIETRADDRPRAAAATTPRPSARCTQHIEIRKACAAARVRDPAKGAEQGGDVTARVERVPESSQGARPTRSKAEPSARAHGRLSIVPALQRRLRHASTLAGDVTALIGTLAGSRTTPAAQAFRISMCWSTAADGLGVVGRWLLVAGSRRGVSMAARAIRDRHRAVVARPALTSAPFRRWWRSSRSTSA